jgi:hypothetical protein
LLVHGLNPPGKSTGAFVKMTRKQRDDLDGQSTTTLDAPVDDLATLDAIKIVQETNLVWINRNTTTLHIDPSGVHCLT